MSDAGYVNPDSLNMSQPTTEDLAVGVDFGTCRDRSIYSLHFTEDQMQNLRSWLRLAHDEDARATHNVVVQRAEAAIIEMVGSKVMSEVQG